MQQQKLKNLVVCEIFAKRYLLNDKNQKIDFIEAVPQDEQHKLRQRLKKLAITLFQKVLREVGPKQVHGITFDGLTIMVALYHPIDTHLTMVDFIEQFYKTGLKAKNTLVVFNDLSLTFDNFRLICARRVNIARMQVKTFPEHWQRKTPPPELKEWNMWVGDKSISIRPDPHMAQAIPFANDLVTKDTTIWFQWNTEKPAIALTSSMGFNVKDVIISIQKIIVTEYETQLELMDGDELGSIDTLYFNPKTKHVTIDVTF